MSKIITLDQLKANNHKDSLYLLISGKVYDCTKFIDEHPGGDEVLYAEAGADATEAFEDVGHSDEARELLPGMLIGEMDPSTKLASGTMSANAQTRVHTAVESSSNLMYFVPLGVLGAYFAYRFYSTGAL